MVYHSDSTYHSTEAGSITDKEVPETIEDEQISASCGDCPIGVSLCREH